jgi:hypothetical protein
MNKTSKHLGGIAAALALTVGLVGCASRTSTTTSATTSTAPKATTTTMPTYSQSEKEDALVKVVQARLGGGSRSQALDLAKQACTVIDTAGSVEAAIRGIVLNPSIDSETGGDMAYIMGVSIPVFCPEYLAEAAALN